MFQIPLILLCSVFTITKIAICFFHKSEVRSKGKFPSLCAEAETVKESERGNKLSGFESTDHRNEFNKGLKVTGTQVLPFFLPTELKRCWIHIIATNTF